MCRITLKIGSSKTLWPPNAKRAKIAEDYAARARAVYKCQAPETLSFRWADPRTAGQADAGDDIAAAIRVRSAGGQPDAA